MNALFEWNNRPRNNKHVVAIVVVIVTCNFVRARLWTVQVRNCKRAAAVDVVTIYTYIYIYIYRERETNIYILLSMCSPGCACAKLVLMMLHW